jgi:hypothetical protein
MVDRLELLKELKQVVHLAWKKVAQMETALAEM